MSIAQHSVAREGDAHPEANQPQESGASAAIGGDTRNLPYLTLRAHQRSLTMPDLPQRARCALAAITLTVDCARPLKEVFARRTYLADRAGLSERTWYRAEADLVDAGLITVAEQGRKGRHGRFGSAYIYLTETAAKALGLIGAPVRRKQAVARETAAAGQGTDAGIAQAIAEREQPPVSGDSFDSPTANMADPYTYGFYQSPLSQKRQQGALPADLERLRSLGFHKNLIFKLMKQARLAGKRLSDVVEVTWVQIKAARFPISYLQALLRSKTDFAWQCRERREEAAAVEQKRAAAMNVEETTQRCAGHTFYSHSGKARFEVSQDSSTLSVLRADESSVRSSHHGWQADFVAALESGQVIAATSELERAFALARQGDRGHAVRAVARGVPGTLAQALGAIRQSRVGADVLTTQPA
ncbi:replication protein O [Paraburkholderia flagellata]|uniref:replication protein O n=1 Tax=Paraburkholderia flagellata TaxID=2883241 RepID=UPI001F349BA2|nr:replication protein O [Paraburkholderia flagellata]